MYPFLLHKQRWNTCTITSLHLKITCHLHRWKDHICYDYMTKKNLLQQKSILKWNGLVSHWFLHNKQNITWPHRDTKFLFLFWVIFHLFTTLTREIFFNTWREILCLCMTMKYPLYILNLPENRQMTTGS